MKFSMFAQLALSFLLILATSCSGIPKETPEEPRETFKVQSPLTGEYYTAWVDNAGYIRTTGSLVFNSDGNLLSATHAGAKILMIFDEETMQIAAFFEKSTIEQVAKVSNKSVEQLMFESTSDVKTILRKGIYGMSDWVRFKSTNLPTVVEFNALIRKMENKEKK